LDAVKLILLGKEREVRERARALGVELDSGVAIVDPSTDSQFEDYVQTLVELRKHKGLTEEKARELMADRTYFGTMMVYKGRANGMVSGATTTTAETIRPSLEFVKTKPGFSSVSSVFFMCLPESRAGVRRLRRAAQPDARATRRDRLEQRGDGPRVRDRSPGSHAVVLDRQLGQGPGRRSRDQATRIARERNPEPTPGRAPSIRRGRGPDVPATKLPGSAVAGRATVFIFPDLNTGNNTYKAVQRSSGAIAIGPVLQGLNKPVNDLSRGATVVDIVNTVIVTAIQAQ